MHLSYTIAPSDLLWTEDLFTYIQAFKAGTLDTSAAFEQNGWVILPEIEAHGQGGPFTAYFAIKAGLDNSPFSILNPLTNVAVWSVENHQPVTSLLQATEVNLSFLAILAAGSASDLEKLIFSGDDVIGFTTPQTDTSSDTLRGWDGNDTIEAKGSGGSDFFYGGTGNDRISVFDGLVTPGSGQFHGYGDGGRDTVLGDERADRLYGGNGNDSLVGNGGHDLVQGGSGNDTQQGGAGRDTLNGGAGADVLFAGLDADRIVGGAGADLFIFTWGGVVDHYDSGGLPARRDVVADFAHGEDLIRLVESALATITLMGSGSFTATNQVRWLSAGGNTTIFINGDADLAADMAITLLGVTGLDATDFQLG